MPMSEVAARALRLPADTRTCLAFFSRLPVRDPAQGFDLRAASGAWPLAGALIGLAGALVLVVALTLEMPPLVAALLALAALAAMTGAMHEDGLADLADGLGGTSREARLAILRDSHIGTFGVLALFFGIGIRLTGLAALAGEPWRAGLALVLVAALARAMALWHWRETMPARGDGLAHAAGRPDKAAVGVAAGLAGLAALALLAGFGFSALLALILAAAGIWSLGRIVARLLGGHTGDTIGAAEQLAEALLFAGLSAGAGFL